MWTLLFALRPAKYMLVMSTLVRPEAKLTLFRMADGIVPSTLFFLRASVILRLFRRSTTSPRIRQEVALQDRRPPN